VGEPEHIIQGARKLNPTNLLSLFGDDHQPEHVHAVEQVPSEGEFTLPTEKPEFTIGSAHPQKLADVSLDEPHDERKEFVRLSQKCRPTSDDQG
jgi:hypothetical protein